MRTLGPTTTRTPRRSVPTAAHAPAWQPLDAVSAVAALAALPHPHGDLTSASIDELGVAAYEAVTVVVPTRQAYRRSARELALLLSEAPGETWQERWSASGWETQGRLLADVSPDRGTAGWSLNLGLKVLAALRCIAPSVACLQANAFNYAPLFLAAQRDPLLDSIVEHIGRADAAAVERSSALRDLAWVLTSQAIPIAGLTPEALIHFRDQWRSLPRGSKSGPGRLLWDVLVSADHFPSGTPLTLRLAETGGQRSISQLVDKYPVRNQAVRLLLIDYLTRRAADGMDYSSASGLVRRLTMNFWSVVEDIAPDQDDLRLSDDVAREWRQRVGVVVDRNGTRPRGDVHGILHSVRALYLDLQSWAVAEPERWGPWVAPCPVAVADGRSYAKARRRLTERMADRTRQRQPLLPLLVEHVTTRWDHDRGLLEQAAGADVDACFDWHGDRYTRVVPPTKFPRRGTQQPPILVRRESSGDLIRVQHQADRSFWTWAVVEVLRHTALRMEELLELTQLSARQFRRPSGEVVALLVIAPSKTDRERVIPMSPELFHVVAQVVRHHRRLADVVPLVRRWDGAEREHSAPMPFLFQHRAAGRPTVFNSGAVLTMLRKACAELAQTQSQFAGVRFTPHDFRRIFATEVVNNGLPIHIGAALLGHTNLQTTRGYVAVFDEDVVRHYQQYLQARRHLRPAEEYRPATDTEWTEFTAHFDKRKVELGNCGRPYGTNCAHEHACVRCPMLHLDPAMLGRLDELELDLRRRRARAEEDGWLGELEGIDLTLDFLADKRRTATRSSPRTNLGMPELREETVRG